MQKQTLLLPHTAPSPPQSGPFCQGHTHHPLATLLGASRHEHHGHSRGGSKDGLVIQRKTIDQAVPGRRATRWPLATTLLTAVYLLLFLSQLAAAQVKRLRRRLSATSASVPTSRAVLTGGLMLREGHGALLYDEAAQHAAQQRSSPPTSSSPRIAPCPTPTPLRIALRRRLRRRADRRPLRRLTLLELSVAAALSGFLARSTPSPPTARWLAIPGALAYQPLHALLLTGQSSTLVLLGLVGLYAALKADRQGWAASPSPCC
ncbi:MAG: hypothetical protein U0232_15345 [Thermomicrobiales bacterium]